DYYCYSPDNNSKWIF
nr:immunoglobulin light chain junction region [Macaca mulatta]